jgi:predicted ATPase
MTVNRLSRNHIEGMAERVAGGKKLPDEVLQQIVEKTDGVPLFVEEMTKAVLESGTLKETGGHYELVAPLTSLTIPATLQDSLMARLDRLVTAKGLAQQASVIGRQFSYELLQAVSQLDEGTLQKELSRLVEAELLYQRGLPPQSTYTFKHALIQDTAYESLLRSTRQQYHAQIANVLDHQFPETAETQPELLAHHYTEAGINDQAVSHWHKAGQKAVERSAYEEATRHLTQALEILPTLPHSPGRIQRELGMLLALRRALMATKGHAPAEVEAILARARNLCQQAEDSPELFGILRSLAAFHLYRAELQTVLELLEQCRLLAQRLQDPGCLQQAYERRGLTLWLYGKLTRARDDFEQAIALHDLHRSHAHIVTRMDPGVLCRSCTYLALVLWLQGYPDQALMRMREGLALAEELSHTLTLCNTLTWTAMFHLYRREPREAQGYAETCMTLATEQGFPQWMAEATVALGWALTMQGRSDVGIGQIREGQDGCQATGTEVLVPHYLALRAEAHGNLGQPEAGLALLGEALSLVDETGMRKEASELHRLKGELLLQLSPNNRSEAESCFHQALSIARSQQAKSWELRAATSLSRLWKSQDKRDEARKLLAEVYDWFTEGFDTADLKDAKALLDELS